MKKNIEIDKNLREMAKNTAARIENAQERKRAYALATGALALAKALQSDGFGVSFKHSLFKVPSFAGNFELADLYIGNVRIDVRVTFDNENFYIPKTHKKYDAAPDLYVVVKMEKNLSKMSIEGFVFPKETEKCESVEEYLVCPLKKLNSMKGFKKAVESVETEEHECAAGDHQKAAELAVSFLDGEISESEKIFFIKHVVNCPLCRERLCEFSEFDSIIEQVKKYPELLDDSTLNVLTGNVSSQQEEQNEPEILETGISNSVLELVKDAAALETGLEAAETVAQAAGAGAAGLVIETAEETAETLENISDEEDNLSLLSISEEDDQNIEDEPENEEDSAEIDDLSELEESGEELNLTEPEEIPDFSETPGEPEQEEETVEENEAPELLNTEDSEEEDTLTLEEDEPMELLEEAAEEMTLESDEESVPEAVDEGTPAESAPVEEIEETDETEHEDIFAAAEEEPLELETHDELELSDLETLDEHEEMVLEEVHEEHPEEIEPEPAFEENEEAAPEEPVAEISEHEELTELESDDEPLGLLEHEEIPDFSQDLEETAEPEAQEPVISEETEAIELTEEAPEEILPESGEETIEETIQEPEEPKSEFAELLEEEPVENNEEQISEYAGIELIDEDSTPSDEPVEETQPENEVNEEIQGLLDDELMQLLSSDDDSDENTESEAADDNNLDLIAESGDSESENQEENGEEVIDSLYEEAPEAPAEGESAQEEFMQPEPGKNGGLAKKLIAAAVVLFLITTGSITALYLNQNKQAANQDALPDADMPMQDGSLPDAAANLPQNKDDSASPMSQDLNKSITNVFSDQPAALTITKISWEVSQSLANDDSFRNYLQVAGKNLQMNLQNDLSYTTEINYNPKVKVSFEISKDNTIKRIQVTESSGSEQIDNVVLQSIKETLKYVNAPNIKDYKGNYNLSVVVNF
ncbi:TPA: TonB C-terminal domain-containing protein [Candidatus Spyradomonas excrementavium]|nr:TonB C-terminal domain-containing protein [Candidatus Spyradomonas excrementavium]